jgi:hypothetical protein
MAIRMQVPAISPGVLLIGAQVGSVPRQVPLIRPNICPVASDVTAVGPKVAMIVDEVAMIATEVRLGEGLGHITLSGLPAEVTVVANVLPVGTQVGPIAREVLLIGTQVGPIARQVLLIGTDVGPVPSDVTLIVRQVAAIGTQVGFWCALRADAAIVPDILLICAQIVVVGVDVPLIRVNVGPIP